MELQTYINNHENYISDFKKLGFKVNSYKNLRIVSYPYDKKPEYNSQDDMYKLYLKGAVIDIDTNRVICLPPIKSLDVSEVENQDGAVYQSLIDGTMINLFYHGDKWLISTRSEIGGYNKWTNKKPFRQMFDECCELECDSLNKDMSYSFVMKHTENRNVSPVHGNELILVEIYKFTEDGIKRLEKTEYPELNCTIHDSYTDRDKFMNLFQGPVIPYYIKGYTVKCGDLRYKWINPYFEEVRNLKINMNNHLLNYVELRRNGNLKKYLRYYPEHSHLFNNYKEKLHNLSNDLFTTYKNVFVHKSMDKKEIPYHLNPLVYDIHKRYLKTKVPTNWESVKDYIHTVPSKKLVFAMNYL
uniref:RNA ligase n=1 Tax=viral metagenome TaxID=1070528 RepID=A0A6C0FEQ9_9ZZZZ|tara:strand:- start:7579 stop:8646 length:1068 start_codon:yes stop_codon:yes gene_type:complete